MKKEVWIRMVSKSDAEDGPTEILSKGNCYLKDGAYHLLYDGIEDEESNQIVHHRIRITPERVEVTRRGSTRSYMVFQEGESHQCEYQTPYGMMLLTFATDRLNYKKEEDRIMVGLEYRILLEGVPLSTNSMEIQVVEA